MRKLLNDMQREIAQDIEALDSLGKVSPVQTGDYTAHFGEVVRMAPPAATGARLVLPPAILARVGGKRVSVLVSDSGTLTVEAVDTTINALPTLTYTTGVGLLEFVLGPDGWYTDSPVALGPIVPGFPVGGPAGPPGQDGPQGPEGEQGQQGNPGPKGDRGNDGAPGADGAQGADGADGTPGLPGAQGQQGAQGPAGGDGDPGPPGDPGPAGADGVAGAPGAAGPPGAQGQQGQPGNDGDPGPPGDDGPAGIQGTPGAQGSAGPQGSQGQQGIDGDKGDQGDPGPAGPTGPTGPSGAQGPPGNDGADGRDGDPGPAGPAGGAGTTPNWAAVLAAGNSSGANDPSIQGGRQVQFAGGAATGDINSSGGLLVRTTGGNLALDATLAAADITVNTVGGIAIQAGATPITAVTGNDVIVAADADIRLGAASGVNITAGSAAAGAADAGDIALNATGQFVLSCAGAAAVTGSGVGAFVNCDTDLQLRAGLGAALYAGFASVNPASGNVVVNGTTGIALKVGAASVTTATADDISVRSQVGGVALDANFAAAADPAAGDILLNATSGVCLKAGAAQQATAAGIELVSDTTTQETAGTSCARTAGTTIQDTATTSVKFRTPNVIVSDLAGTGQGLVRFIGGAAVSPSGGIDGTIGVNTTATPPFFQICTSTIATHVWPLNCHGLANNTTLLTVNALTSQITAAGYAVPAGSCRVGTSYRFEMMGTFVRGATATPLNLVIEISVGGVAIRAAGAAMNTGAGTYGWTAFGMITFTTIGGAGVVHGNVQIVTEGGTAFGTSLTHSRSVAATAIDTTVSQTFAFRANMSAAVAATSLNVTNATIQRVVH